jgi:Icc-related predicted phosphoesterase
MRLRKGKGRESGSESETLVFFATDIHGSDVCFRKFVNAGKFYGASHLIIGGDITGKSMVPIRQAGDRWTASFGGRRYDCASRAELAELEQAIGNVGQYSYVAEDDELQAIAEERDGARDRAFKQAVVAGMERWMKLADERLSGTGIRCYVTPGNDDFWEVDDVIRGAESVEYVEGRRVRLDERHEMITTGYSNFTPWKTEREVSEEELASRIAGMWNSVEDPGNALAVIHVPPVDTNLDVAPALGADLNLQAEAGGLRMTHVGSTAVRSWIDEQQPLLGLFGHVHESKAAEKLGRTLCVNPGSQYTGGVLEGVLIRLGDGEVLSYQLVSG